MGNCPPTSAKDFKKSVRGSYESLSNGQLEVVQWNDNKNVIVASNIESSLPIKTVSRWDKQMKQRRNVTIPNLIAS